MRIIIFTKTQHLIFAAVGEVSIKLYLFLHCKMFSLIVQEWLGGAEVNESEYGRLSRGQIGGVEHDIVRLDVIVTIATGMQLLYASYLF